MWAAGLYFVDSASFVIRSPGTAALGTRTLSRRGALRRDYWVKSTAFALLLLTHSAHLETTSNTLHPKRGKVFFLPAREACLLPFALWRDDFTRQSMSAHTFPRPFAFFSPLPGSIRWFPKLLWNSGLSVDEKKETVSCLAFN